MVLGAVVTRETDFLDFYRRLGLDPGCSLDELKQAYRRHVAALHPDRQQGRPGGNLAEARLQRLTSQYGAAMAFHRRHGRLPGARGVAAENARSSVIERGEVADPFAARSSIPFPPQAPREAPARVRRGSRAKLFLLLGAIALVALGWMMHGASLPSAGGDANDDAADSAATADAPPEPVSTEATLRTGMSTDEVREVEGEPVAAHGDLWEYGPSWIRFDHGEVVEWHSSPLRPLHTNPGIAAGHMR